MSLVTWETKYNMWKKLSILQIVLKFCFPACATLMEIIDRWSTTQSIDMPHTGKWILIVERYDHKLSNRIYLFPPCKFIIWSIEIQSSSWQKNLHAANGCKMIDTFLSWLTDSVWLNPTEHSLNQLKGKLWLINSLSIRPFWFKHTSIGGKHWIVYGLP